MNCPICKTTQLLMTTRGNIEIDYCPDCRGVWLDRGELDKIVEKSNLQAAPTPDIRYSAQPPYPQQIPQSGHHSSKHGDRYSNNSDYYPKKKKDNWIGEIFDF